MIAQNSEVLHIFFFIIIIHVYGKRYVGGCILCFVRSSLPCFLTSGIPTSCYIFKCFLLLCIYAHECKCILYSFGQVGNNDLLQASVILVGGE